MDIDYYSLLARAVAGKDETARDNVYRDAFSLIQRSPNFSPEAAASHVAALETAIRRIEDELVAEGSKHSADVNAVLLPKANPRPLIVIACMAVAFVALSGLLYGYLANKGPVGAGMMASSSKTSQAREEAVMGDLKTGVDGGSSGEGLPFALQRQVVFYRTTAPPGSIVIDRETRFLYLIDSNNSARRYGIGIAQECLNGGSFSRITGKLEWPDWKAAGVDRQDGLLASAGRPGSLLGARALLLDKPGLLIHGTNSPKTIGHLVASGCIRLVNDDVEDLYRRVSLETRVVFVG
ncbi:L,D-transpeptidase [Bradyrhizobium sp. 26S5]|uniref:L,D-transpeptidase n=1 Tax=Bradyrhizobium sp. 26S5 TaxID=3139729 RepID=UPI0030D3D701